MKQILSFLLFLLPALAFAQWPAAPNKIRLGNQTTGDGLIYRSDSLPDYTPTSRNNAWLHFDTVAKKLYFYEGGTWQEYASGGGVQYSDSLTVFVTPTQLSDSIVAIPTIYTADGTLTGNRTINGDNNFIFLLGGFFSTVDSLFYAQNSVPGFIPSGVNYTLTSFSSEIPAGITVNNSSDYATATAYYNNAPFSSLQSRVGADSSAVTVGNGNIFLTADTLDATNVTTFLGFPIGGGGGTWLKPELEAGNDVEINGDSVSLRINGLHELKLAGSILSSDVETTVEATVVDGSAKVFFGAANNQQSLSSNFSFEGESLPNNTTSNLFATINGLTSSILLDVKYQEEDIEQEIGEEIYSQITITTDTLDLTNVGNIKGLPTTDLLYTGAAGVIELDAGGTPVYIAEGSGVDVTQSGDTLTITGKGTRFVQDSITGATLTIDLNEAPTAIISLKMTSATSVTLTISNPYGFLTDATAPTYEGETGVYTFRFWGISGTDNVTWPANFYDMNGTALGTDALTAGTAYTCYYDPLSNEYYCK